ncbi:MAG: flagellar hook assembly protein FlgD [Gammaproteobacteria bacterium]|nr:MAG: flagellar hook assembly protein FlgD [Gammaproteobacteria bacterium]
MATGPIDSRLLEQLGINREQVRQKRNDQLGQADFLKLMTTQLSNQDPFKPMESGDFLAQIAQFGTVNGITELQKSFQDFSSRIFSGQALQAASLIGREVLVPGDSMLHMAGNSEQIAVDLPNAATDVEVSVYTASGQLVDTLRLGPQEAGLLNIAWDGTDSQGNPVPTGEYRFEATVRNGTSASAANLFMSTRVLSVSLDRNGGDMQLETEGLGRVDFSDVRRIA